MATTRCIFTGLFGIYSEGGAAVSRTHTHTHTRWGKVSAWMVSRGTPSADPPQKLKDVETENCIRWLTRGLRWLRPPGPYANDRIRNLNSDIRSSPSFSLRFLPPCTLFSPSFSFSSPWPLLLRPLFDLGVSREIGTSI